MEPPRWERVTTVLRGRFAVPPAAKDPSVPGAPYLESVVNVDAFCAQYSRAPTQPDGTTRVWGFNSFVPLPTCGGEFSEDVAQTAAYRIPPVQRLKLSSGSGLWVAAVDYSTAALSPARLRRLLSCSSVRTEKRRPGIA